MTAASPTTNKAIQSQIRLPLRKAAELSWNSIRLRLGRSLLVTSAIVLALAFFVSIQATEAILEGMRGWITTATVGEHADRLRAERSRLEETLAEQSLAVRQATNALEGTTGEFDFVAAYGADYGQLQEQLGRMPDAENRLAALLAAGGEGRVAFENWLASARQLADVRQQLNAPQQLRATMQEKGVPTTDDDIAANRIRTRWLLGLALLVAFVGILNAMLMSVTERFREIGTMKCLGALDGFIVKLFLLESLFQGLVGTIIGVILGVGLSIGLAALSYGGFAFINMPWGELLTVLGISLVVGVVLTVGGALLPAWQAARMHPIEAMRVET